MIRAIMKIDGFLLAMLAAVVLAFLAPRLGAEGGALHMAQVTEIGIADALLSRVSDLGADLLVMGAYSHSRLRERILGGVTRQILAQMTVPVLMAH